MEQYKDCGMDIATYGAIYVGKRSFIGYGATIMPGVKIGQRCVIGAGAIVTHDIPDNSIAVGVPAKVISTMEDYANKCMATHKAIGYDMNRLATDRDNYLVELKNQGKLYNDKKRIFK